MTTETILSKVSLALESKADLSQCLSILQTLQAALKDDIYKESAKKNGRSNQLSAIKRILKRGKEGRESLGFSWYEGGVMVVSDGYCAARLNKPLQIQTLPSHLQPVFNVSDSINKACLNAKYELAMPPACDLAAYIKTEKALKKNRSSLGFR